MDPKCTSRNQEEFWKIAITFKCNLLNVHNISAHILCIIVKRFDSGRLINKFFCLWYRGENQSTFRMNSKIVTAAIGDKNFLKDVTIRINHDSKVWNNLSLGKSWHYLE